MKEFEELAATSPGPGPLCAKVFIKDPWKIHQKEGVTWEQMKEHELKDGRDPKWYARTLVQVIREFDVPTWDRRYLPHPPKPTQPLPPALKPGTIPKYPEGSNGGNGHH